MSYIRPKYNTNQINNLRLAFPDVKSDFSIRQKMWRCNTA